MSSFVAWALGVVVLGVTLWSDANYAGPRDDVAAGLAGFAFLVGTVVFIATLGIGVILGFLATRRAPEQRAADVALGLNVVTLAGVVLSGLILWLW